MQFLYTYQDHEGRVHQDEIGAPSQSEAYSALRKSGVRPMRVWPKDGNPGKSPFRIGKRVLCAAVAATALAVGAVAYLAGRSSSPAQPVPAPSVAKERSQGVVSSEIVEIRAGKRIAKPRPRRQIELPSPADAEKALPHPVERLLMRYARPGCVAETTLPDLAPLEDDFYTALEDVIWIEPDDSKQIIELKRVIQTLKNEAEARTLDGSTFKDVMDWFEQRQKMEADYRRGVIQKNPREVANKLLESMSLEPIK